MARTARVILSRTPADFLRYDPLSRICDGMNGLVFHETRIRSRRGTYVSLDTRRCRFRPSFLGTTRGPHFYACDRTTRGQPPWMPGN